MTYEIIIQRFGNQSRAAEALGVSRQAISAWKRLGIPPLRMYQIEAVLKQAEAQRRVELQEELARLSA